MTGVIIRNTGSWYVVRLDDGQLFECKVKGNFRLRGIRSTNPVAVGDRVEIKPTTDGSDASASGKTALITEIHDRRNYIIRRASNLSKQSHIIAANVDLACLVVTIVHPETNTTFIDRFLASAEAYRVPVALVFNKVDLYDADELRYLEAIMSLYRMLNYECFAVSAQTGEGLDAFLTALRGKTTLFSGNSGVGKSTLLNSLVPEAKAKTAMLSAAHDQGQHTTTFSEMYDLEGGGCIIDTPGIRGFGTFDFEPDEVSHYFREIFQIGRNCRFGNCTHTHEPGCAVQKALDNHEIAESRYLSYLSMLEDKDEGKYREKF
ncbi:MAG: ribosome small subunit-dependent GTPase A [Prevotella sp.]|nr:ribosome small subunit-dependent GTPase A [Bacteroidaceae bacterium]MBR6980771.1 ribosome small subunit-dependent GTPase A [Prevotella sp.]